MSEHWLAIETHGPAEIASVLLVVLHGLRSPAQAGGLDLPAASEREPSLRIEFIGLSLDEQQKALASFPGGARFRLHEIDRPAA